MGIFMDFRDSGGFFKILVIFEGIFYILVGFSWDVGDSGRIHMGFFGILVGSL